MPVSVSQQGLIKAGAVDAGLAVLGDAAKAWGDGKPMSVKDGALAFGRGLALGLVLGGAGAGFQKAKDVVSARVAERTHDAAARVNVNGGGFGEGLLRRPKADYSKGPELMAELKRLAATPRFRRRARDVGFTDKEIDLLPDALSSKRAGQSRFFGGWTDDEVILIGKYTFNRERTMLHELGHVLDDAANPGLFQRSQSKEFGFGDFLAAERVAYGMQFGPDSLLVRPLAGFNALHAAYPAPVYAGLGLMFVGGVYGIAVAAKQGQFKNLSHWWSPPQYIDPPR